MERGPEISPPILNAWLGDRLLITYMCGPDIDLDDVDRMATGQSEARVELLYLDQIGTYGIAVKKEAEGSLEFIPWGAVLRIVGIEPTEPDDAV
jgi:hypothetical protein